MNFPSRFHAAWRATGLAVAVYLASCAGSGERAPGCVRILSSFYPMHIMVMNLTQSVPGVKAECLAKAETGCLHDYVLTPQDLVGIEAAAVLVINGGGMENFLGRALAHRPKLPLIDAGAACEPIVGAGGETNAHFWASPLLAMLQVSNIRDGLCRIDPTRAGLYRANADRYLARIGALRQRMHDSIERLGGRRMITFHEAFPYFAREFGLAVEAVIEREPGSEPSAGELADLVALVKRSGVRALFAEPQYPARAAELIARETGATVRYLDPCVSGPDEGDAWLRAMEKNRLALVEALAP